MTNDEEWQKAYSALVLHGDQAPLARLFKGNTPITPMIREHIGRMLDPNTDPEDADRLVFSRSLRLAQKIKTNEDRIAIGMAFLTELAAGKRGNVALKIIKDRYGKSASYVYHAVKLVRNLPPIYRAKALKDAARLKG
jgi:hypothetical protein